MSELCLSSTTPKTTQFYSSLLLSDLLLFFSPILSHPLYFLYFIFFSPYLLKLLSFLSPLFITTSLLILGFLTLFPGVVEEFQQPSEELEEAYKIVFDTSNYYLYAKEKETDELSESKFEENCFQARAVKCSGDGFSNVSTLESLFADVEEKTVEIVWEETTLSIKEEKSLEGLFKELDEFEDMFYNVEETKVDQQNIKSVKVEEFSLVRSESEAIGDKVRDDKVKDSPKKHNGGEYTSKVTANSQRIHENVTDDGGEYTSKFEESPSSRTLDSNLGSYGSMRREKEWKRTLACKLFEERHNVDGGEGMDSLWETYEMDSSNKSKQKSNTKKKNNNKNSECEYYNEDEEEEDEGMDGQLCCLQALKFSTGKMNLGMGRPNLVKISKAIKGIGWFHHVTKHGRKGYK